MHKPPALFTMQSILPSASMIPATTDVIWSSWVTSSVLVTMFGTPSSSFTFLRSRAVAYTFHPPRFASSRHLQRAGGQCREWWCTTQRHTGVLRYRLPSTLLLLLLSVALLKFGSRQSCRQKPSCQSCPEVTSPSTNISIE